MASEIAGLFTTPEQYQLAQQQAQQAQALQYAQQDPRTQAQYGAFRGGQQLANAIGGALGIQDPQLQIISRRQQLASQLDPTNIESYKLVAQAAMDAGDQQFAMAIADAGRQAAIQVAQANKERQLAVPSKIQEADQIAAITQAIEQLKLKPQTPEIQSTINSLQTKLEFLSPKPKPEKQADALQIAQRVAQIRTQLSPDSGVILPPEVRSGLEAELGNLEKKEKSNIIDVGVAAKSREVVYFDKDSNEQFVMKPNPTDPTKLVRVPYSGGIDKTTANVSATASTKQAAGVNANKIDLAKVIEEDALSASDRISLASSLRELAPKAFTGFAADAKLSASKVASAFGIPTKGGSESEIIDQILGQMTIGSAGQLKGSLSDKDVLFLKKTIGTRGLSLNTLLYVADEIERRAAQDRNLNKRINDVTSSGGNLNEVNFESERTKANNFVKEKHTEYRNIMKKVGNNTATLDEAKRAKQIRDDLGLQ